MKYASIDTETTGVDPETCQILSIGIVLEDTEKQLPFSEIPKLHIVIPRNYLQGEPYALNMNAELISIINQYNLARNEKQIKDLEYQLGISFVKEDDVSYEVMHFLHTNGFLEGGEKLTVAGKNYLGFDAKFLNFLVGWDRIPLHRRTIDPATSFVDWKNDKELPSLDGCKQRAGLSGGVTHNAVEDAFDVVKILRTKY